MTDMTPPGDITPGFTKNGKRTGKFLGYVRVSSVQQNTERQLDGIELDKVFMEKVSSWADRPQLSLCLEYLREGDVLYVHSIDRLVRSLRQLQEIVEPLVEKGVTIMFVKENLRFHRGSDFFAKFMLQVLGAVAEFERSVLRERQREGYEAARKAGKMNNRRPRACKLNEEEVRRMMVLVNNGLPKTQVAQAFGVSRKTVYQMISRYKIGELKESRSRLDFKAKLAEAMG